jgi:radical SAM superfamily enzyme YgiQ (UPF0313 family)
VRPDKKNCFRVKKRTDEGNGIPMKIDLYHLYRRLDHNKLAYPIALDVLKSWAASIGWEARVKICRESKVNLSSDAEVVGISVYTQTASAAYRLGDKLRKRGKLVILGGPHFRVTRTQVEATSHCDILVHSICEQQWINILNDIAKGRIGPDHPETVFIVDKENRFRYPNNFYDLYRSNKWYQIPSVPTSLGCPYDCSFCSPFLQGSYILRDVETIYNEVARIKEKVIFICDASFGLKKKFTIRLMRALAPLEKKFLVETTLARLKDEAILDCMAYGGVRRIMVGIETFSLKLKKHGADNLEESINKIVDRAQKRGMQIQGNVICGLDSDGPDSFERIYKFYQNSNLDSILINLLTPYPTTGLYEQLLGEGRIFDTNWEHYDYHHLVYQPKRMTIDQLIDGYLQLYRSVSKGRMIFKDSIKEYWNNGINAESTALLIYNLYATFDARRKERELRENQRQMDRWQLTPPP